MKRSPLPLHTRSIIFPPHTLLKNSVLAMHANQQTFSILSVNSYLLSISQVKNTNMIDMKEFKLTNPVDSISSAAFIDEDSLVIFNKGKGRFERWNLSRDIKVQVVWNFPIPSEKQYSMKWCIDHHDNQMFLYVDKGITVLSLSDGKEIGKILNPPQKISHMQMNKMNSNQIISISSKAEICYIDKKTFETISTINVEQMMLNKLKRTTIHQVKSVAQDECGYIYLAVDWYYPMIQAHSGMYDSVFYLVTLKDNMIILEDKLIEFKTAFIGFDNRSKLLLRANGDMLHFIRLKEFTLFESCCEIFSDITCVFE